MTATLDGIYEIDGETMRYRFHAGQLRAWDATQRFVIMLSGTQGGKTTMGPPWMFREIRERGPGDHMVVTPSFPLLDKKALPEMRRLFEDRLAIGRYVGSPSRRFEVSEFGQRRLWGDSGEAYKTTIWFGYAADPDSLEAATAKSAWLDEAGQPAFKVGSWEAIMRRLSINSGRVLLTTTPYYHGWLKRRFWDTRGKDPTSAVVNFRSIDNPAFPIEEYERARRELPPWKFQMFYNGIFTQPAGQIYDCFDRDIHVVAPFAIPPYWITRLIGLDFGGVHMAAVFTAQRPDDGAWFLYREYLQGGMTAAGHVGALKADGDRVQAYGGAKSEGQWRSEFGAAGLHVYEPKVSDVEVGIDRVYKLFSTQKLFIFETCTGTIDQLETYSRPVDEEGNVFEGIVDKSLYHYLDALRYIGGTMVGNESRTLPKQPTQTSKWKV